MSCEICGKGTAFPKCTHYKDTYRGVTKTLAHYWHWCNYCGSEFANSHDMQMNKQTRITFEKQINKQYRQLKR